MRNIQEQVKKSNDMEVSVKITHENLIKIKIVGAVHNLPTILLNLEFLRRNG